MTKEDFLKEFDENNFEFLGSGGYGTVVKAKSKIDSKFYAIKYQYFFDEDVQLMKTAEFKN